MKKRKSFALCLVFVTMMLFTSCVSIQEEVANIDIGTVTENVFESQWLNMKVEIPKDWKVLNQTEMAELMGVSEDELELTYSFLATDRLGSINVQLAYDILDKKTSETMTQELYAQQKKEEFSKKYDFVEEGTRDIAGKTYNYIKISMADRGAFQEHYFYKLDDVMINLAVTYIEPQDSGKEDFINSITTLE